MVARGDLTDFERGTIVGARLAGVSVTKAAEIANVSRATVSKVMSAWEKEGKTTSSKANSGRKRLLAKSDTRTLVQIVKRNKSATAEKLCAEFNVGREHPVSLKTVRRELHRAGCHWRGTADNQDGSGKETESQTVDDSSADLTPDTPVPPDGQASVP